jgi:hypothetical protein
MVKIEETAKKMAVIEKLLVKIKAGLNKDVDQEYLLEFDKKGYVIKGLISDLYSSENGKNLKFIFIKTSSDKYKHRIEAQLRLQFIRKVKKSDGLPLIYIAKSDLFDDMPTDFPNFLEEMADIYKNRFDGLLPFVGDILNSADGNTIDSTSEVKEYFEQYVQNKFSYPSEAVKIEYRNGLFHREENCLKFIDLFNKIKPALYK